LFDHNRS